MKITIELHSLEQAREWLDRLAGVHHVPAVPLANPGFLATATSADGETAPVGFTAAEMTAAAEAQPAKRGRKPRQTAEPAPTPTPVLEAPAAATSFLDEDDPVPATKQYTKDDARAALVALQLKRQGQLLAAGDAQAAPKAEAAAKKILLEVGGSERLGSLAEAKYGAVIDAANKAAAE